MRQLFYYADRKGARRDGGPIRSRGQPKIIISPTSMPPMAEKAGSLL